MAPYISPPSSELPTDLENSSPPPPPPTKKTKRAKEGAASVMCPCERPLSSRAFSRALLISRAACAISDEGFWGLGFRVLGLGFRV